MGKRITDPVEALAEKTAERVIDLVVRSLDVNALIQRVDPDAILDRVDVIKLVHRVDVDAVADRRGGRRRRGRPAPRDGSHPGIPAELSALRARLHRHLSQRDRRALQDLIAGTAVVYAWDTRAARLRFLERDAPPRPG